MADPKSIVESLLNRGRTMRNLDEPWWSRSVSDSLSEIPKAYERAKLYKGNELDDTYGALQNLLQAADTEEGMNLFEKRLNEFSLQSKKFGGFDDNISQAESLKLLGNRKRNMQREFGESIQNASDLMSAEDFLDKADEFVNIQATMDDKNIKGSVADYLQSELASANSLRDKMVAGFNIQGKEIVGTNFRYNKAKNSDKETFRKLNLYRERLDLATKSLAGDGKISTEEAKAILLGDSKHYFATKAAALRKAEDNYKANRSRIYAYDEFINKAKQKRLSGDDLFKMEGMEDSRRLEMGNNLVAGEWDAIEQSLLNKQADFIELKNTANDNYKNWYGSYFEDVTGGLTSDEVGEFDVSLTPTSKEELKKVAESQIGIDLPEKDATPEQIAETKKARRRLKGVLPTTEPDDPKIYSSSENILEGYIKGDVSSDSLREIGGQSLVNKASRIKSAYKGEYAGKKLYKGKPISDIDTLKELKYGDYKDRYSWHDVVSSIYGKKERGLSVADDYLTGGLKMNDLKLRYRTRRTAVENIKNKFKEFGGSLEDFKKKYRKDYETLINLLGKSRDR